MTETETAWLAGLLEGEGCFDTSGPGPQRSGRRRRLRVAVKMTDYDVVRRAADLMGVSSIAYERARDPKWRDAWRVTVGSARAETVMRAVLPHMGERRAAKIRELLAMPNLSHHPKD